MLLQIIFTLKSFNNKNYGLFLNMVALSMHLNDIQNKKMIIHF